MSETAGVVRYVEDFAIEVGCKNGELFTKVSGFKKTKQAID
ncbi:MAG: hypothetical protein V3U88_10430 [Methylococcales bacterium]